MIFLLSVANSGYDKKNSFTTFCRNSGVSRGSKPLIGPPPSWASAGDGDNIALQPGKVVLHPGRHHRTLDQIPLIDFEVGAFHDRNPAVLIGIVCDQARISQRVIVDCHNHTFNRREQIQTRIPAVQGDELLSLTNPAVGSAYFNVVDLAHQIGDELIDPNPRILGACFRGPHVSQMKAISLWNLEPVLPLHNWRFRFGHNFGFHYRLNSWFDEISDADDQQKHQQHKQD